MADGRNTPSPSSNMEKAEGGRWKSEPDTVEADQSTQTASGLSGGRPERTHDEDEDVVARTNRGEVTPRRYDQDAEDDVTPSDDDGSIGTKI